MQDDIINRVSSDILKLAPTIQSAIFKNFSKVKMEQVKPVVVNRNAQDITTDLDHQIGLIYIDQVFAKYKNELKIDSEEESERVGSGKITLRFDPIDGSKHFYKGIPVLGSTASLVVDGVIEFAMVLDIFPENVYHAFKNRGSFLNEQKIHVSDQGISDDFSFVMYESPNSDEFLKDPKKFDLFNTKLETITGSSYRIRNPGLSSTSICLVADGSSPAFIDFSGSTKLYDVEAAALIAKEAGAVVGDIDGNRETTLDHSEEGVKKINGNLLIANPKAFEEISKLLSENR